MEGTNSGFWVVCTVAVLSLSVVSFQSSPVLWDTVAQQRRDTSVDGCPSGIVTCRS